MLKTNTLDLSILFVQQFPRWPIYGFEITVRVAPRLISSQRDDK